jgi:hypothetical protein
MSAMSACLLRGTPALHRYVPRSCEYLTQTDSTSLLDPDSTIIAAPVDDCAHHLLHEFGRGLRVGFPAEVSGCPTHGSLPSFT